MFEETLYQSTAAGKPFVDVLREQGIIPGIKVDTGLQVRPPYQKGALLRSLAHCIALAPWPLLAHLHALQAPGGEGLGFRV